MKGSLRITIRSIVLTALVAPLLGFLLVLLLELFLKIEISKLVSAIINLVVVAPIAFLLFPRVLGIPFGITGTREYLKGIGFYFPSDAWKHILLGLILAGCALSGMIVASFLTGRYTPDLSTINLPHIVFCLNPALWEELFFRGVLMILLLQYTRSLKKAFVIQVIIFGLTHIKGIDLWAFVDVFSVMIIAIGLTFAAHQTRSLVAGIIFHYFHDVLLYFVQPPGADYFGFSENAIFYALLWLMIGVGCAITWLAAEKFGVRAKTPLYDPERV
jgi:membrane protease YdiL (CAAX protease family)